jgi:hypothetical protein
MTYYVADILKLKNIYLHQNALLTSNKNQTKPHSYIFCLKKPQTIV